MHWVILFVSAVLEAVWATALGASDSFSWPVPTAVFLVALVASMLGLGWAMREIPIGTAYALWTGLGAALTVAYAMATGAEPITFWRAVFLAGIVGAALGLKLLPTDERDGDEAAAATE